MKKNIVEPINYIDVALDFGRGAYFGESEQRFRSYPITC